MKHLLFIISLLLSFSALAKPRRPQPITFRGPVEMVINCGFQYAQSEIGSDRIFIAAHGSWQPLTSIRILKKKPNRWQAGIQLSIARCATTFIPTADYYDINYPPSIPQLQNIVYKATVATAGICMQRMFNMHIMEGFAGFNVGYAHLFSNNQQIATAYRQEHNGVTTGVYLGFSKDLTQKLCITTETNLSCTVFGAERLFSFGNSIWDNNRSQTVILSAPVTVGLRYKFN